MIKRRKTMRRDGVEVGALGPPLFSSFMQRGVSAWSGNPLQGGCMRGVRFGDHDA